jgi:Uma2 family endonuclease
MATAALIRHTPEEYFALEASAEHRSEYIDGQIIAMSPGALRPHNLLVGELVYALRGHLRGGPCEVYPSTQRVKVSASGDYLYPDVMVSCDPLFEAERPNTLLTPLLVIEVLSESTENRDRGTKLGLYKRIESLQECVLVSQTEVRVERHVRAGDLWPREVITDPNASLVLASIGLEIPLATLYEQALQPTRLVSGPMRPGEHGA